MQYSANETQVGGDHYRTPIQHWDFAASWCMGYFEGQITKYVTRSRKKNGLQDLYKAAHFLRKLRELADQKPDPSQQPFGARTVQPPQRISLHEYMVANRLTEGEASVVALVTVWGGYPIILVHAYSILTQMIAEAEGVEPGSGYVNQD